MGVGGETEAVQVQRKHGSMPELSNYKKSNKAGVEGGREKASGNEIWARLW